MRQFFYLLLIACMAIQANAQIVINEISYNSPETGNDSLEYIELFNAGNAHVDMTGWYFTSGIVDTLPSVHLQPGEYFVTAINAGAMLNVFQVNVHEWMSGALSNNGETITLVDADGNIVDSVAFDDSDPWPTEPDNNGPSLELKDAALDNNDGANWQFSGGSTGVIIEGNEVFGTPGEANSAGGTTGPAVTINLAHLQFEPANVVVALGDSVRWVNNEAVPHNVNGQQSTYPDNTSNFFSGVPAVGPWQFDYQFLQPGLNDYRCDVHFSAGMRGTVAVYDPDGYTEFPLDHVRLTDGINGQHIFNNIPVTITGVVHGVNYNPTGYSFYVINEDNVGINVFSFDPGAYIVNDGDEVAVRGVIDQFNGQLEIIPDEISIQSSGNPLVVPKLVEEELTEEEEGSYLFAELLGVDSVGNVSDAGYTIYTYTQSGSKLVIRIDADANIDLPIEELNENAWLSVWGFGTQFDGDFPFNSGYQILASEAYLLIDGLPFLEQSEIQLSPNPANDLITLKSETGISKAEIYSMDGKLLFQQEVDGGETEISLLNFQAGLHMVKVITQEGIWVSPLSIVR